MNSSTPNYNLPIIPDAAIDNTDVCDWVNMLTGDSDTSAMKVIDAELKRMNDSVGTAGGVASLDETGGVPYGQLRNTIPVLDTYTPEGGVDGVDYAVDPPWTGTIPPLNAEILVILHVASKAGERPTLTVNGVKWWIRCPNKYIAGVSPDFTLFARWNYKLRWQKGNTSISDPPNTAQIMRSPWILVENPKLRLSDIVSTPEGRYVVGGPNSLTTKTPAQVLEDIGAASKEHTHTAEEVAFTDGETFQSKLDAGKLTGPKGDTGDNGAPGAQGPKGDPGAPAKVCGKSADASGNIRLTAEDVGAAKSGGDIEAKSIRDIDGGNLSITGYNDLTLRLYQRDALTFTGGTTDTHMATFGTDKVTGVPDPTDPTDAANKAYVDGKMLVFREIIVPYYDWAPDETYYGAGYKYRAALPCAGVTASHRPDVAFGVEDTAGGNFAPVSESYDGGVYIYAKDVPYANSEPLNIVIPSIVCIKGV